MLILRMLQEKYSQQNKKIYHIFVNFEKAFDHVPRKAIKWALRRKDIPERMVEAVMALNVNSRTRVKAMAGISEDFNILVSAHQGSVLSPLLFIIVFIVVYHYLYKEIRKGVPWELMYVDDLKLTEESQLEVEGVFEEWKAALESKGLKVNMEKTKLMVTGKELRHRVQSGRWSLAVAVKESRVNSI